MTMPRRSAGLSVNLSTWHRGEVVACTYPWQIFGAMASQFIKLEVKIVACFVLLNIIVLLIPCFSGSIAE